MCKSAKTELLLKQLQTPSPHYTKNSLYLNLFEILHQMTNGKISFILFHYENICKNKSSKWPYNL